MTAEDQKAAPDRGKQGRKNASPSGFGRLERVAMRLAAIGRENPSRLRLFQAVYGGRATRGQSIKAMCLDCCGFDTVAVKDCGDRLCPLWKFRPFQRKTP